MISHLRRALRDHFDLIMEMQVELGSGRLLMDGDGDGCCREMQRDGWVGASSASWLFVIIAGCCPVPYGMQSSVMVAVEATSRCIILR